MATFNQFKNNTQILRKYLQKMNTITQSEIKPQWVQQNFLKQNNPHLFLQLLHYVLIEFSPFVIFVKVLDYYPTIKDDNDKKFVTNVMNLARKMFEVDVKIDIQQFLSPKFAQKKTQWMAQFCKSVYQMHLKENKTGQQIKSSSSLKATKKLNEPTSLKDTSKRPSTFIANDDDSEDQAPRNLNVLPSNSRKPTTQKSPLNFPQQKTGDSSQDQDMRELLAKKNQLNKMKQKMAPNEQKSDPLVQKNKINDINQNKRRLNQYQQQQRQFIEKYSPKNNLNKVNKPLNSLKNKNLNKNQQSQIPQKDQNQFLYKKNNQNKQQDIQQKQYVTRQQLMQIMGDVSKNFSQILNKFSQFQQQVGGWVQNINAKISIIEENVKTIKNNL